MKPEALFCTGCGERVDARSEREPSDGPGSCAACHVALRPGSEFCVECGEKVSHRAIDLTVGAAAVEAGSAGAKPSPADRVSPAASRAILGSVSGGMGSYVGKAGGSAGAPAPPNRPSGSSAAAADAEHRKRSIAIFAVAAVMVLVTVGVGVLLATQKDDGSKVHTGRAGALITGSDKPIANTQGTTDSGGSSTSTGSTKNGSSGKGSKSSGSGSKSSGSSGSGGGHTTTTGGSGSSHSSGGGSHTTNTPKGTVYWGAPPTTGKSTPKPPTTSRPVPPHLSVAGAVALTGARPQNSIRVTNSGGGTMHWSASRPDIQGVSISPSSGSLQGGQSQWVTLKWTSWLSPSGIAHDSNEGNWSSSFVVNAGSAGSTTIAASADNRAPDILKIVYIKSCSSASAGYCGDTSTVAVSMSREVDGGIAGGFVGAQPIAMSYSVDGNAMPQFTNFGGDNTYPARQVIVPLPSYRSIKDGVPGHRSTFCAQIEDAAGTWSAQQCVLMYKSY